MCKRCGGTLFLDEGELACFQCGARYEVPKEINPSVTATRMAPSPAPTPSATTPLLPSELNIPWFAPRYIRFTPDHIIFLLIHLEMIRSGHYPPDPRETGYTTGFVKQKGKGHHAYYEKSVQIAAEIGSRLARCGLDRYLVEDYYCRGVTI